MHIIQILQIYTDDFDTLKVYVEHWLSIYMHHRLKNKHCNVCYPQLKASVANGLTFLTFFFDQCSQQTREGFRKTQYPVSACTILGLNV